jgi:uncharacterized protein (DUF1778 family)
MARARLISIRVPDVDLEMMKVAAAEDRRSLTNLLITAGMDRAREILKVSATRETERVSRKPSDKKIAG